MKKFWPLLLIFAMLLGACAPAQPATPGVCGQHADADNNGICDVCAYSVYVLFDFYAINDLHGKLADGTGHPGVDELTTYLKNARATDAYAIFLSAGDMWQGSSESNLTKGQIMVDWMNELDFAAMTLGNHEYDWGSEYIEANSKLAEFPFLAINIYDRQTNARVEYCEASVVVEGGGLQIGIIGAMGDCYSSIAVDKCQDVYFKTGKELTDLVKEESTRLQAQGVDFIVYVIHDGYGSTGSSVQQVTGSQIRSYYDTSLSDGYVDLVFEGHTHKGYRLQDEHGVYHLQNRGDNKGGISHVEVAINSVTGEPRVREAELVSTQTYQNMVDDPVVAELLEKYKDVISDANRVLGYNSKQLSSGAIGNLVAELYYRAGSEKWGKDYEIVLAGGSIDTRSPYNLSAGDVTYAHLQALLPFDNELALCSIKGSDLKRRFLRNDDYRIYHPDQNLYDTIDDNATYYVLADTWSAYYSPNKLTVIELYGSGVYARDFVAAFVETGGLSQNS